MDKHILESKIEQLRKEASDLERQIHELESKKYRIERERGDYLEQLERIKYHGMTRLEYFRSFEGSEILINRFKIKLGSPYSNHLTISMYDEGEDLEFSVSGAFDISGGILDVYRRGDYAKGTKHYSKKYYGINDVPKKRLELYKTMVEIKDKYGKMMENAEIKSVKVEEK